MQPENETKFELLLADADDGTPTLQDGFDSATAGESKPDDDPDVPFDFWGPGDQNDLDEQRWGVIVPRGKRGDDMLAAIKPLIEYRKAEQEGVEPRVYRVPPNMSLEEASLWRRTEFDRVDESKDDLPRYQLILGDLHEVSTAIQEVQGLDGYVGRLAFDALDDYAAYAQKAIESERQQKAEAARSLFYTVHDGTAATRVGHQSMVEPSVRLANEAREKGTFITSDLQMFGRTSDPVPDELFEQTAGPDPAVLMSVSHGAGAPRNGWASDEAQRAAQGAMSFGREGKLLAEEFKDISFLPFGFWLMFACFGAGTPADSKFRHWLDLLRKARAYPGRPEAVLKSLPTQSGRPFISAHAKVCLANPRGPLAIVGHLDLAWSYSFQDLDTGKGVKRPARFLRVLDSVLKGDRYGLSICDLQEASGQANKQLLDTYDSERRAKVEKTNYAVNPAQRGHLWMMRQDLAGYVLLGDPAARLPILSFRERRRLAREARRKAQQAQRPVQLQSSQAQAPVQGQKIVQVQQNVQAEPVSPTPTRPKIETAEPDVMEDAVLEVLAGDTGLKDIAKKYGVNWRALKKWEEIFVAAGRRALEELAGE